MIGALYARVSTDEQTEFSIDAQIKEILKYANVNGIYIPKENIFIDEGISGKRADKRPEFMRMIGLAKSKQKLFEILLIHKFDRFARSREDSIVYKTLLRKEANVKVVSITEKLEDDKISIIIEAILEAMAEYYSLNLAEEVKKGMTEKAERGEYQTRPPFGLRIKDGQLYKLEKENRFVEIAFQKFADYEMNTRQLAVYFNGMGVTTRDGNKWNNRSIDDMLGNLTYIGCAHWTPSGRAKRRSKTYNTIVVENPDIPKTISRELWDKVQQRRKEIKELYPKYQKPTSKIHSWVNGLVFCGNCEKALINMKGTYMQCNGYSKGSCTISCCIRYTVIENAVLEQIKETYNGCIEIEIVSKNTDEVDSAEHDLIIDKLERLKNRLLRAKEAYMEGIDTKEEYRLNKTQIAEDEKVLQDKLRELKDKLLTSDHSPILQQLQSVYALLIDPGINIETKYKTAHYLIRKIIYTKQEKTLKIIYK